MRVRERESARPRKSVRENCEKKGDELKERGRDRERAKNSKYKVSIAATNCITRWIEIDVNIRIVVYISISSQYSTHLLHVKTIRETNCQSPKCSFTTFYLSSTQKILPCCCFCVNFTVFVCKVALLFFLPHRYRPFFSILSPYSSILYWVSFIFDKTEFICKMIQPTANILWHG